MLLDDLGPRIRVTEVLQKVDGRWALVSKHNPKKVLQYYTNERWTKKVQGVINEGGNAFKDPATKEHLTKQDASTEEVHATVKALEKRIGIPLFKNLTGSAIYAGKTTGDGDVNLDPADFIDLDPAEDPKTSQNRFREWLTGQLLKAGFKEHEDFKKGGDGLTVKAPIPTPGTNEFLQVDLDIGEPGQGEFSRWSRRGEPGQGKGAFRHILMSGIARAVNPNWKWSFKAGLFDEESSKTLSRSPDEIAKYLFGKTAKATDLDNIQTILAKLKQTRADIYQAVVDKANDGIANMKYDYRLGQ